MPRFFFISESGDGAFLARRFAGEGHKVRMYAKDPQAKDVYRGLIPLAPHPIPERGEIVVFDMSGFGTQADQLKRRGFKTIAGAAFADMIEMNRPFGQQVMRACNIKVPETMVFRDFDTAISFLKGVKGQWYYKPSGHVPTSSTHNAEARDLAIWMENERKHHKQGEFMLQRKVEGTEISLEGWFDGASFALPWNSTIEDKKFLVGDLGPRTGCMANLVWAYEETRPHLAEETVARIAPFLGKAGYVGPVDLNMIVTDQDEIYGLEWSCRFGYDALQALSLLTQGDFGRQMADFAEGRLDGFSVRDDAYALTAHVSVPPYPNSQFTKAARGVRVDRRLLLDDKAFLGDIMLLEGRGSFNDTPNGELQVTGADATVVVIGDVGKDLPALRESVLERVKRYEIPDAQYRIDLVKRAESVLSALNVGITSGDVAPARKAIQGALRERVPAPPRPSLDRNQAPRSPLVVKMTSTPTVKTDAPTVNE